MRDPYRITGIPRRYRGCRYCPGVSRWDICPPDQDVGKAVEGWHRVSTTRLPPHAFRQRMDGSAQSPGSMQSRQRRNTSTGIPLPTCQGLGENTLGRCYILVQYRKNHLKRFLGGFLEITASQHLYHTTCHDSRWVTAQALVTTATISNPQLESPTTPLKIRGGSQFLQFGYPTSSCSQRGHQVLEDNSRGRERNTGASERERGEKMQWGEKKGKWLTWQLALNLDKPSRALHLHWDTPNPQSC